MEKGNDSDDFPRAFSARSMQQAATLGMWTVRSTQSGAPSQTAWVQGLSNHRLCPSGLHRIPGEENRFPVGFEKRSDKHYVLQKFQSRPGNKNGILAGPKVRLKPPYLLQSFSESRLKFPSVRVIFVSCFPQRENFRRDPSAETRRTSA